jgi:hypothetical protein
LPVPVSLLAERAIRDCPKERGGGVLHIKD